MAMKKNKKANKKSSMPRMMLNAKGEMVAAPKSAKGDIYDKKIHPLVEKIIELSKKHKIPFIADFQLEMDHVVTANIGGELGGSDKQYMALGILAPEVPAVRAEADRVMMANLEQMMGGGGLLDSLAPAPSPLEKCGCEICTMPVSTDKEIKTPGDIVLPPEPLKDRLDPRSDPFGTNQN